MARRRLLLLLKPLDVYPSHQSNKLSRFTNPKMSQVINYLDNRRTVHNDAINFCQNILKKKFVDWDAVFRSNLSLPIHDVDLVVTIGGDGTLLQASHFMDNSIPILGVNSDPTKAEENTMMILMLQGARAIYVQQPLKILNRIWREGEHCSPLVNSRSSGLRVSTAAGSTAAMLSAGGFAMPILCRDLQYLVREPISPGANSSMHGVVKSNESMHIKWFSKEGLIYVDGSHVVFSVQFGDMIELSPSGPSLKVFLPSNFLS